MKPAKFKMTELGPIPSDWEVKRLGEMLSFKNGFNANAKCYGTGTPVASVLDALSNEPITTETIATKVTADDKDRESFSLTKGDLIFTRSSETLEDVGRANVYFDDAPAMFGGFVIRGRFKIQANPIFVNYLLKTSDNRLRVMSQGAGAQHFNIGQSGLENVLIALPPLPEQHRIAAALSDVDELIGALGKLVEKKRAIKTGVMQRLLTGQTRLPGFGGAEFKQTELGSIPSDWEVKRLGECGTFIGGSVFPLSCQGEKSGDYPFFKVSDFSNAGNEYTLCHGNNYISKSMAQTLRCQIIPNQSIVFAKIGAAIALERKRIVNQDSCIDNNMMAYCVNNNENVHYFVVLLRQIKLADYSESTALPALNVKRLKDCAIVVPPLPEQRAIAAVLSDMDEEIAALEAEKRKVEAIKQGMMQELLTGKTRLLKGE